MPLKPISWEMPFLFRNGLSRKCAVYSQAELNYSANESLALCSRSYVGYLFKRSVSRFPLKTCQP